MPITFSIVERAPNSDVADIYLKNFRNVLIKRTWNRELVWYSITNISGSNDGVILVSLFPWSTGNQIFDSYFYYSQEVEESNFKAPNTM